MLLYLNKLIRIEVNIIRGIYRMFLELEASGNRNCLASILEVQLFLLHLSLFLMSRLNKTQFAFFSVGLYFQTSTSLE